MSLQTARLSAENGIVWVPAFTDLKLHDITSGPNDPNREAVDMNAPTGSDAFFRGNGRFLTRKLWGAANEPPYFHHGMYTTLRESVLAHAGGAAASSAAFKALPEGERDAVIEFLKSLQVLPPNTPSLVIDERGRPRTWRSHFDSPRPNGPCHPPSNAAPCATEARCRRLLTSCLLLEDKMGFIVHVVRGDDRPARGVRVRISFTSILRGITPSEYTDSDGQAEFDGFEDGEIEVFLNGTSFGTYDYEDGGSITLSLDAGDEGDDDPGD